MPSLRLLVGALALLGPLSCRTGFDSSLCEQDNQCEDFNPCTVDRCLDGQCISGPTDLDADGDGYTSFLCPGGSDCDDSEMQVNPGATESFASGTCEDSLDNDCDGLTDDQQLACRSCTSDTDCDDFDRCNGQEYCGDGICRPGEVLWCDDGLFCNGEESCHPDQGCRAGVPPCPELPCQRCQEATDSCQEPDGTSCDDGDACSSTDSCQAGNCVSGPADLDADGDGHPDGSCIGGDDCSDSDPNNWASCDSCQDEDQDGYYTGCDAYVDVSGPDCEDGSAQANPGQQENQASGNCSDGLDNDCDGIFDQADLDCGQPASYTQFDYNGDGIPDVAVGAPGAATHQGKVYIFYGGTLSAAENDVDADVVISGTSWSAFGNSISSAGDLNHDGRDDLVVGAVDYNMYEGRVFIFYGGSLPASLNDTDADVIIDGGADTGYFGHGLAPMGDVNQDGFDDLLIGSYCTGGTNHGAAYLYYGGALPAFMTYLDADVTITGTEDIGFLGHDVAAVDLNDDGIKDLVIPERNRDTSRTDAGAVYIYHGGSLSAAYNDIDADVVIQGSMRDDGFGAAVASGGDINNDGREDLIVGSYSRACIFYGGALAASLSDTDADVTIEDATTGDGFGSSAGSGDVNGDGISDVIVGAVAVDTIDTNEGAVYVFHGGSLGASLSADQADVIVSGTGYAAYLGVASASVGDLNQDTYDDLIMGAYNWEFDTGQHGRAFVLYGGNSLNPAYDDMAVDVVITSTEADAKLGASVGDGAGEIL